VFGAGGSRPASRCAVRGIILGNFLTTQMLNPAFWWLLCLLLWNFFLLFENYG